MHYFLQTEEPHAASETDRGRGRFLGKIYVLTDASNSSATFTFALAIRQQRLGTLVGTPTGGSQRGINGGAFFFLTLPDSQLEIDLPLIGYFPTTEQPDEGLTPDILIPATARDIAKGLDPIFQASSGWLREEQKHRGNKSRSRRSGGA